MARGGVRKGAGRPKKADEEKARTLMLSAIRKVFGSEEDLWVHICTEAQQGCSKHTNLLLNHFYGKPTEKKTIEVDTGDETKKTLHLHIKS